MRLSRPCYDKMHRCPGWAGGGMRYTRVACCDNGRLRPLRGGQMDDIYRGRLWRFKFNRCDTCDVLTLPYVVRYLDWRHWHYELSRVTRNVPYLARETWSWLRAQTCCRLRMHNWRPVVVRTRDGNDVPPYLRRRCRDCYVEASLPTDEGEPENYALNRDGTVFVQPTWLRRYWCTLTGGHRVKLDTHPRGSCIRCHWWPIGEVR